MVWKTNTLVLDPVISMLLIYCRVMIQGKFEQIVNVKTWDRHLGHVWDKGTKGGIKLDFKWS